MDRLRLRTESAGRYEVNTLDRTSVIGFHDLGSSSSMRHVAPRADDVSSSGRPSVSPFDTAASSGTRFLIEIVAWTAGPWAAADVMGSRWWAVPAAVVLVALPALFNTPGDKKTTGIPTPGVIRILIEMLLLVVAVAGAWLVWPVWAAVPTSLAGVALVVTGLARYRWLAAGAPRQ